MFYLSTKGRTPDTAEPVEPHLENREAAGEMVSPDLDLGHVDSSQNFPRSHACMNADAKDSRGEFSASEQNKR